MTKRMLAESAEGLIFNEIVALLTRQQREPVDGPLRELKDQLEGIYASKVKDIPVCQMGLALANFGMGDHREAIRLADNAVRIAGHVPFVIDNALLVFLNAGYFSRAYELAIETQNWAQGEPETIDRVINVLGVTMDFAAAIRAIEQRLKVRGSTELDKDLFRDLAAKAERLGYSQSDLLAITECAASTLHSHGRKIYNVDVTGRSVSTVTLEIFVDASVEDCAALSYEVADALFEKFNDKTAVDLMPISIRSFAGQVSQH